MFCENYYIYWTIILYKMKAHFLRFAAVLFTGATLLAVGCTDYAADIQTVDKRVDNLATELNGKIASLEQQIAGINATIATLETVANHNADIEKLNKAITDLETALKEDYQGKIQTAVDNLTTEINKKVNQADYELDKTLIEKAIRDVNDALDAAKDRIKALEDADFQKQIDDLNAALDARLDKLEALLAGDWKGKTVLETINSVAQSVVDLETVLNGKISALDERVTNAEAAITNILEVTLPALRQQVEDLENAKLDKATFDAYKEATAQTISLMQKAIQNLADAKLDKAVFNDKVAEIMKKFDDYVLTTTFQEFLKVAATDAELAGVKAELEGRIRVCEDLLAGDWGGKTVQQYILSLMVGGQEGLVAIVATKAELDAVKAELEGRIRVCEDLLAGDWGGKTVQENINAVAQAVADLETSINGKLSALDLRLTNVEKALSSFVARFEEALGRVQSVVFVPAFEDGKMTVSAAGSDINTFKIMPAEAAKDVVELFTVKPSAFSFDVKTVATRSGEGAVALRLSVAAVKLNPDNADKGWVDVSVSSNCAALSSAEKALIYSAALVVSVSETGTAISSPFYNISLQ